jgi:exopolysaccharide biosynthesis predicted pyruvyltransferase EpsI
VGRFHAISVRESHGLSVCADIGRPDAVHVVDPTIFLDRTDYRSLIQAEGDDRPFEQALALAYFVNVRRLQDVPWTAIRQFALSGGMDLRVVPLQGSELVFPSKHIYTPSPTEWLNAFDKAECVMTNSYHGALFSILMRKPFLAFLQGGHTSEENSRFSSALEPLGLSERIISQEKASGASARDIERWMSAEIDWDAVGLRLADRRERSERFLFDSLEGV